MAAAHVRGRVAAVTLWHFTCEHGGAALGAHGVVLPPAEHSPRVGWDSLDESMRWLATLSWFTDQPDGYGAMLGRRTVNGCDRLTHRYRVADETGIVRWCNYAHDERLDPSVRWGLEHADTCALPTSWYVCAQPVQVTRDALVPA